MQCALSQLLATSAVASSSEVEPAGGVETGTAVVLALGSVALLIALHLLAPHIRKLPLVPEAATGSFAGGVAVSYVFLHLLPELSEGNVALREVLGEEGEPGPLLGLEVFLVALLGFVIFYGLDRLAHRSRASGQGASVRVFWVHLGSFMVYNGIIAYSLPLNYRTSVWFAVLFTVAMALHFVLVDRGLAEHYGSMFDGKLPRLLLAAALVVGWAFAAAFAPSGSLVVTLMIAFLAGSVLLNVFKEEIPSGSRSSYKWFVTGIALYGVLMGLVTLLHEGGA